MLSGDCSVEDMIEISHDEASYTCSIIKWFNYVYYSNI